MLRQIREEIAKNNDIELVIEECTHRGNCRGTCPRCESEVRYLEAELEKRRRLQKTVALAGISAGMAVALSGCAVVDAVVDVIGGAETTGIMPAPTEEIELDGEIEPVLYESDGYVMPLEEDGTLEVEEEGMIPEREPADEDQLCEPVEPQESDDADSPMD